ncbi:MAG TPA: hypothetical protein DEO39_03855 [Clostridiales bacterium]|nr:hypothetical protein [Clostridiales bacterium]
MAGELHKKAKKEKTKRRKTKRPKNKRKKIQKAKRRAARIRRPEEGILEGIMKCGSFVFMRAGVARTPHI